MNLKEGQPLMPLMSRTPGHSYVRDIAATPSKVSNRSPSLGAHSRSYSAEQLEQRFIESSSRRRLSRSIDHDSLVSPPPPAWSACHEQARAQQLQGWSATTTSQHDTEHDATHRDWRLALERSAAAARTQIETEHAAAAQILRERCRLTTPKVSTSWHAGDGTHSHERLRTATRLLDDQTDETHEVRVCSCGPRCCPSRRLAASCLLRRLRARRVRALRCAGDVQAAGASLADHRATARHGRMAPAADASSRGAVGGAGGAIGGGGGAVGDDAAEVATAAAAVSGDARRHSHAQPAAARAARA